MKALPALLCCCLTGLVAGCLSSPDEPANDDATPESTALRTPGLALRVMSQNIYVGTDVDAVITALATPDPSDDVPALLGAAATLQETDFTVRAAGFADAVARLRPHVIGLSEVSRIDIDLDLTAVGGPHVVAHEDFLPELLAALRQRQLHYRVAAVNRNFVVSPIPGVSLEDFDVTLVDAGVLVGPGVIARNFAFNVGEVAPGVTITYGFTAVPVGVAGRTYQVITSHLQDDVGPADLSLLRAAQMHELTQVAAPDLPVIIMGDLNDPAGTPMYGVAAAAGFTDVWAALHPTDDGFTCCHSSSLTTSRVPNQRIDFILARGFGRPGAPLAGRMALFGVDPSEMVAGPSHPIFVSDHVGLIAALQRLAH